MNRIGRNACFVYKVGELLLFL